MTNRHVERGDDILRTPGCIDASPVDGQGGKGDGAGAGSRAGESSASDGPSNRVDEYGVEGDEYHCLGPIWHCILNGGAFRIAAMAFGVLTTGPHFLGFGIPILFPPHPTGGMSYATKV